MTQLLHGFGHIELFRQAEINQFNPIQLNPNQITHITYSKGYVLYNSNFISWILYLLPYIHRHINYTKFPCQGTVSGHFLSRQQRDITKTRKMCNKNKPNTLFLQTLLWTLMTNIVLSGQDYSVPTFAGRGGLGQLWVKLLCRKIRQSTQLKVRQTLGV